MPAIPSRALSVATALCLGVLASPSLAQGTAAQREACAPDAIRLCQDTIPDVPKTAACMKAHVSELSASCRRMVVASTAPTATEGRPHRRTARARAVPIEQNEDFDVGALAIPDEERETPASRAADVRNARRVVGKLCRSDILDASTCRLTNAALDLAR